MKAPYSKEVMEHFRNPRNMGEFENPDGVGLVGNPICGDMMEIQIKVENDRIGDIRFRTYGCGAAIATSSMTTELAKGKTLDEAMKITKQDVADKLGGLPPIKMHCSNLASDALHKAIKNYREKKTGVKPAVVKEKVKAHTVLNCANCGKTVTAEDCVFSSSGKGKNGKTVAFCCTHCLKDYSKK